MKIEIEHNPDGYVEIPQPTPIPELPYEPTDYVDALEKALAILNVRCEDSTRLARGKMELVGALNAYYMTRRKGREGVMRDITIPLTPYMAITIRGTQFKQASESVLAGNVADLMAWSERNRQAKQIKRARQA